MTALSTDKLDARDLRNLDEILRDPLSGLTWENRIMAADAICELLNLRAPLFDGDAAEKAKSNCHCDKMHALASAPQPDADPTLPWRMAIENAARMAEQGILSMDGGMAAAEIRSLAPDRAALPAPQPEGQVPAKPFEWVEYDADHYGWKAPLFGEILAKKHWKGHWVVVWSTPGYTGLFCPGHFASAGEAKSAAEARIIAALTLAPDAAQSECLRCGSVGGFGCYECIPPDAAQTVSMVCRSCGADLSVKRIAACCRNPAPDVPLYAHPAAPAPGIAEAIAALRDCDGALKSLGIPVDAEPRSTARAAMRALEGRDDV